jgi:hypothetical protein
MGLQALLSRLYMSHLIGKECGECGKVKCASMRLKGEEGTLDLLSLKAARRCPVP